MLYHNQINARALIGQSGMVYCAGKCMEISLLFWINNGQSSQVKEFVY